MGCRTASYPGTGRSRRGSKSCLLTPRRAAPKIAVLSATPQLSIGDMASGVAGAMRMNSRCATVSPARCGCVAGPSRMIRNALHLVLIGNRQMLRMLRQISGGSHAENLPRPDAPDVPVASPYTPMAYCRWSGVGSDGCVRCFRELVRSLQYRFNLRVLEHVLPQPVIVTS